MEIGLKWSWIQRDTNIGPCLRKPGWRLVSQKGVIDSLREDVRSLGNRKVCELSRMLATVLTGWLKGSYTVKMDTDLEES